ncbi:MAG TPA: UDP-3-O-(3-hydroxymyristoyl)glucosamine N-acyltransferase [Sedimentisphaerales bacterium]|nr:UDP-3-O-(3-hydroxymyristoyl)glucosamine N-acyltransferase [Sedimentisphaerales bacterium]
MKLTVTQLAGRIGAELVGDGSGQISGVGAIESAGKTEVTFIKDTERYGTRSGGLTDAHHTAMLQSSKAGAVIVSRRIEGLDRPQLIVRNVDAALIKALNVFAPKLKAPSAGVDSTAKVGQDVKIGPGAAVGPYVVIDDRVEIGANTVIAPGCRIGEKSRLGNNCRLDSNVVVYHDCTIGNNVIIQANTTIGSTGFGYCFIDGSHQLVPHNGGVVIEDFVEIGANCCVDRAKFGNTVIGAGTKIDNLVQIAHNVIIGKCCLIAGQGAISGSCKLGDRVVLGGQVGLVDNIEIGDGAMVGAKAGVMRSVGAGEQVLGIPAIERKEALRVMSLSVRLPKLAEQLKQLIKRMKRLEAAKDNKE